MDVMEAILSRRSIRQYTNQPVSEDDMTELLKAAMSAPSAGNEQPWQFVVIRDRKILNAIPVLHPSARMLLEAPLAILVCGDLNLEQYKGHWVMDCSAATQNILLAAHAKGLGATWVGVYLVEERVAGFCRLLGLPDHVIPLALVPIGYPAERKEPANNYNPARVHWDRWGCQ